MGESDGVTVTIEGRKGAVPIGGVSWFGPCGDLHTGTVWDGDGPWMTDDGCVKCLAAAVGD